MVLLSLPRRPSWRELITNLSHESGVEWANYLLTAL